VSAIVFADFRQNKKPPRDETWRPFDELINSNRWVRGYGHCGKKFAAKVPGEVLQSPAPGADTETFV
jgi:hypothetical protein